MWQGWVLAMGGGERVGCDPAGIAPYDFTIFEGVWIFLA